MTTEHQLREALKDCGKALPVLRTILLSAGLSAGSALALEMMLEVQAALALPETPVRTEWVEPGERPAMTHDERWIARLKRTLAAMPENRDQLWHRRRH